MEGSVREVGVALAVLGEVKEEVVDAAGVLEVVVYTAACVVPGRNCEQRLLAKEDHFVCVDFGRSLVMTEHQHLKSKR